jgi:hypothetical protein
MGRSSPTETEAVDRCKGTGSKKAGESMGRSSPAETEAVDRRKGTVRKLVDDLYPPTDDEQ